MVWKKRQSEVEFLLENVRSYVELTKPRIVFLLVFTSLVAMVVASSLNSVNMPIELWFLGVLAITLGCAGCNVVTCYVDRDVDAVMTRTRHRPLPSGRIAPLRALYFGLILILLSLALALLRNLLAFGFMALGALDNVVVYSLFLKRRTPVNIILGGISGGLPVAFGWVFVAHGVSLAMVVMAALVVLWIPNHIWSLAIRYRGDYEMANIPMLPVVVEEKQAVRCVVSTSLLLVLLSPLLFFLGFLGLVYLVISVVAGLPMLLLNLWLFLHPTKKNAWIVFKFSSPYLAIIFLAMLVDVLL